MQLNLFEDVALLFNESGFTLEKPFRPTGNKKFGKLESTQMVRFNGETILYLQENDDGTFNTFSFNQFNLNITLEQAIKTARKLAKIT